MAVLAEIVQLELTLGIRGDDSFRAANGEGDRLVGKALMLLADKDSPNDECYLETRRRSDAYGRRSNAVWRRNDAAACRSTERHCDEGASHERSRARFGRQARWHKYDR